MKLNAQQIADLIDLTAGTTQDAIGCDGCYELLDQFAQAELDGIPIPESLKVVHDHLVQCKCCRDEYSALLTGLRELEG